ncbi:MAG: ABC transporter permease [Sulfolobales archaeon]
MYRSLTVFYSMVYRQLKRFIRARSRVIAVVIQPILWVVLFGMGMGGVFNFSNPLIDQFIRAQFGGVDYVTYLVTGVIAMSVFMGSFISGVTVIFDKQFGFLKETLVAPAPRAAVLLGRAVGDSIAIILSSLVIVLMGFLLSNELRIQGILPALGYGFVLSIGLASLGMAIASRMSSMEGFQILINLLIMPLQFVSGVFFPINRMPEWMQWIAKVNPLTYAVDGVRYYLIGVSYFNPLIDIGVLLALSVVFMAVAVYTFERATIED